MVDDESRRATLDAEFSDGEPVNPELVDGVVLVVDVANLMGSRPDGWWRDRAGAATRLLESLLPLTGAIETAPEPDRGERSVELTRIVAVTEGQSRRAALPVGLPAEFRVLPAPADGDSAIVDLTHDLVAAGSTPLVITADRGLRARLPAGTRVAGPRWLLDRI